MNRPTRSSLIAMLALFANLAALGCAPATGTSKVACNNDDACAAGERCREGQCVVAAALADASGAAPDTHAALADASGAAPDTHVALADASWGAPDTHAGFADASGATPDGATIFGDAQVTPDAWRPDSAVTDAATPADGWRPDTATVTDAARPDATCTVLQLAQLRQAMNETLTNAVTDTDFALLLETGDGRSYSFTRGSATSTHLYESASTSKVVSAVVILWAVQQGDLSLASHPQDFLNFWTPPAGNPAASVTLRHLLSFTSGFWDEPPCQNMGNAGFRACVQSIYDRNITKNPAPGAEFYYASTHLQIAGLMAMHAHGVLTWSALFDDFRAATGLFPNSTYDLPSATNPRLAGGMHWTGDDYLVFLRALHQGTVLTQALREELRRDQSGTATMVYSPAVDALGEDWHYALGNWVECRSATFNCDATPRRNSSPGAYGAYPFVDFEHDFFGILVRQGALGTFRNGLQLYRGVDELAVKWATRSCPP